MEGGILAMNQRERTRLVMMTRVREKAMTIREASEVMGMSYRQNRRIYKRYREEGDRWAMEAAEEARQTQTTAGAQSSFWRAGSDGWQSSHMVQWSRG